MNLCDEIMYIRGRVSKEELLAGLAKETSELTQAALKYFLAIQGKNPAPLDVCASKLEEEATAVFLYLAAIDVISEVGIPREATRKYMIAKAAQWIYLLQKEEERL